MGLAMLPGSNDTTNNRPQPETGPEVYKRRKTTMKLQLIAATAAAALIAGTAAAQDKSVTIDSLGGSYQ